MNLKALEHLFERHGLLNAYKEQKPVFVWRQIVGPVIERLTCPLWVMNGVLHVEVATHVVAHELSLMKTDFIRRMNEVLGEACISDIKFKVRDQAHTAKNDFQIDLSEAPLLDEEREEITKLAATIEDKKLRETFERFLSTLKRAEKARQRLGWKRCSRCGIFHDGEGELCFNCAHEAQQA